MHAALRTAHRTHRARARPAPPLVATPPTPDTTHERHDARRRKDAACPQGHKAGDADRRGTEELGLRRGNGVSAFLLPCERGSHRRTVHGRRHKAPLQPCALTTNRFKDPRERSLWSRMSLITLDYVRLISKFTFDCAWLRFEERYLVSLVRKAGQDLRVVRCALLTHSAATSQRRAPASPATALHFSQNEQQP